MKIAVTGSTGQLGRLVIEQLKQRVAASEIVALARDTAKAAGLGVATRQADYEDPASLNTALAGIETLLLISSSEIGKRELHHNNVITAAKAAGVNRIVYTSLLRADTSKLSLAGEHVATETALRESGLNWTILRNGWYTEHYTASVPTAVQVGALTGRAGEGRISGATRADLAEAAAVVVTTAGHDGETYELAGDDAWTLAELAAEVSKQTGKDIPYRDLPKAEYEKVLTGAGIPGGAAAVVAQFDVDAARGELYHDGRQLSELLGRSTTSLAEAVRAALA